MSQRTAPITLHQENLEHSAVRQYFMAWFRRHRWSLSAVCSSSRWRCRTTKRILPILPPAEASALPELGQQTRGTPAEWPPRCCKKPSAADIPPYPQSFGNEPGLSLQRMTRSFKLAWINYWVGCSTTKTIFACTPNCCWRPLRWQQQQDPPISPARGRPGGSGTVAQAAPAAR